MIVYFEKCNIVNIYVYESYIFFLFYYFRNVKFDFKKMGKMKIYFLLKSISYSCINGGF